MHLGSLFSKYLNFFSLGRGAFFLLLWILAHSVNAQSSAHRVCIDSIIISGNHHTKTWMVRCEIPFRKGDTIEVAQLPELLDKTKFNLTNMRLFSKINIRTENRGDRLNVYVNVRELWYIYPSFIFELADRNFNTWWEEQNRELSRVNIGARLDYSNVTGRNDALKLVAHTGYTNKVEVYYEMPRLTNYNNWGYGIDFFQRTQKEIGYQTQNNKSVFFKSRKVLLRRQRAEAFITYRPNPNRYVHLKAGYHKNQVASSIAHILNPDYFNASRTKQQFFMLEIFGKMIHLDREIYPLNGFSIETALRKDGLGIFRDLNLSYLNVLWRMYSSTPSGEWSIGSVSRLQKLMVGSKAQSGEIPFYNRSFIGYSDDQIRGYELYVIDGPEYFYTKNHIKYRVLNTHLNLHRSKDPLLRALRGIPFEVYINAQVDMGIILGYKKGENTLNDRWIVGGGPGLHVVTFNRNVYKLEWSFNHLGEWGVFFHVNRKY